ncbi:MAG: O-antigen ligase family protein [Crocinitomicaceae bacterium]|nr:O-antigen ligase family protein [Crocinitomicaceae bacterium]
MLNRIFGANTHNYLHILGLSGLAFGLPLNKVVMSVSMMFLVLNLLLEADFKSYWQHITSNKLFLLILAFFSFHAVGLLWSEDLGYGFHDLKVKLPMLIVPLVLTAKPVHKKSFLNLVLFSFITSVCITSFINYGNYAQWFGPREYLDIRGMSLFGSHVRYALLVAMSAGISIYFYTQKKYPTIVLIVLFIWFNYYTFYSQVISGAISLGVVYLMCTFYWAWKKHKLIAISGLGVLVILIVLGTAWVLRPITYDLAEYQNLPAKTAEGNWYYHKPGPVAPETGKPVDIFICELELKREWKKVSKIAYDGKDKKGQLIKGTLIRYMASLDVTKDAVGVAHLTKDDILAIEHGLASSYNVGIIARLYGLQYQLNNTGDPNGHSLLQRLEYWETGLQIAQKNWILGVGTGDAQIAFDKQYELNNSQLYPENRDRTHNMFLTVLLSLGIIGLSLLVWSHFKYLVDNLKQRNLVAVIFISIILVSYLIEDTLETQAGITFFGLFYGLFSTPFKKES